MKPEELIIETISEFIENNWETIDKEVWDIKETKEEFLTKLKSDVQLALWVLTEIGWSEKSKFASLFNLFQEQDNHRFLVIKIKEHYIKLDYQLETFTWKFSFCKRLAKTVYYFE